MSRIPGIDLAQYEFVKYLNKGSFAWVEAFRHAESLEYIAAKFIKPRRDDAPGGLRPEVCPIFFRIIALSPPSSSSTPFYILGRTIERFRGLATLFFSFVSHLPGSIGSVRHMAYQSPQRCQMPWCATRCVSGESGSGSRGPASRSNHGT
jgi:hypothetical protein